MYPTVHQLRMNLHDGHVQCNWNHAAAASQEAAAREHSQLVDAVHATDGISKEQAELQVSAFEKQFKDDPL